MASLIDSDLETRRWHRAEYEPLVDLGMFVGERRLACLMSAYRLDRPGGRE